MKRYHVPAAEMYDEPHPAWRTVEVVRATDLNRYQDLRPLIGRITSECQRVSGERMEALLDVLYWVEEWRR
jgi:hypothetical protein